MFTHKLVSLVAAAGVAAGVVGMGGRASAQPPRQPNRMGYTGGSFKPTPYFPPKPYFAVKPYYPSGVTPFPSVGFSPVYPIYRPPVVPYYPVVGFKPPLFLPPVAPVYPWAYPGWFGW